MMSLVKILALAAVVAATGLLWWQPWRQTAAGDPPKFAEDRGGQATPAAPGKFAEGNPVKTPFDGDRAHKYLTELCDIGPRISGSEGMKKQQDLVVKHFEKYGATVEKQRFEATQKSQAPRKVGMTNIIAKWHPENAKRLILCSHYDTRPLADEEQERTSWNKPFVSANDGTSGVAFLMEMAHHLKDLPCKYGIDIVLFDGEEYIFNRGPGGFGTGDDYFLGSEHFAHEYDTTRKKLPWSYDGAVLFDLFAHKGARLAIEGHSAVLAPKLVEEIWGTAAKLKVKSFVYERGFHRAYDVMDDHMALNRANIPALDILDFDYKHWHKLSDLPKECSGAQMADVGAVILAWLQGKP